ncbi:hypothetical protein QEG73_19645 [Chitinophagaceae bacterium 26-R-25]|nr:hypothetical protein [Chitinophagaceae bacterium 26-R-25]
MANIRRRTLLLSTGKELKLFGNSLAINTTLEVGEGAAPNIFSFFERQITDSVEPKTVTSDVESKGSKPKLTKKNIAVVSNPYKLTREELMEIADYNIRLWLDLKDNLRKYGIDSTKVFSIDGSK